MLPLDLKHALPLEGVPTFSDGIVAAVDTRAALLITSPNAKFIPEIVQGIVDVVLRSDCRYGPVDPIQWPQIFTRRFGYLSAVPKSVGDNHPWAPIFRSPSKQDFVPLSGTPVVGFGFLSASFVAPLRVLVKEMSRRVDEFAGDQPREECADLRWHEVAMRHALARLSLMPATFPDQTLQVSELQRHWLMAAGYLEYQRRLRSLPSLEGWPCASLPLMGAWTSEPQHVQLLYAAGIPVWFVRNAHAPCYSVRIRQCVPPIKPVALQLARFPGTDAVLYHGLVGESHLSSMMQGGHGYLDISRVPSASIYSPDDYGPGVSIGKAKAAARAGTSVSDSDPTSLRSSPSLGRRVPSQGKIRAKPYDVRQISAPHPSQVRGRDKFLEFAHKWMPPPIPSWSEAMSTVDRSMPARAADQLWGYWIPEPALLLGAKDEARQIRYLTNWVRARPIWLYLLRVPGSRACQVGPQLWRTFLNGVPEDPTSTTRNGKRIFAIKNVFGEVVADDQFDPETDAPVDWHGTRFQRVPETLAPGIIWEVFELGFRYELLALDRYLRPSKSQSRPDEALREDLLANVFSGSWLRAVDTLPSAHSPGLFAALPQRRVSALNAFRMVLMRWPGCPSSITSASPLQFSDSTETILELERHLAMFYVDTFFFYSGRAPIVPHLYPL
ncbi:hypothetical protein BD311DRAFT_662634 [Dichomitus squalens]|uniref:Uncharacterized protein n=1 Tax=Dichomitus squalens TaxID=114155 RepID=A0A4Q9MMJ4_9APHY|nr:hypothetical protein BD311DRAFT_662634 [Dichomitus squalens]